MFDDEKIITQPCVGCGFCCLKTPCEACRRLYPSARICPQLLWISEKNRYICGLMTIPGLVGESYRRELYAGEGCCSNLNSWRQDVKNRHHEKEINNKIKEPIVLDKYFQIFLNCLGREMISGISIFLIISNFIGTLRKFDIDEDTIKEVATLIDYYIKNNRTKFAEDFMG